MWALTGDDTGIIKKIDLESNAIIWKFGTQEIGLGIQKIIWASSDESRLLVAYKNGNIDYFNINEFTYMKKEKPEKKEKKESEQDQPDEKKEILYIIPKLLHQWQSNIFKNVLSMEYLQSIDSFVVATGEGKIYTINLQTKEEKMLDLKRNISVFAMIPGSTEEACYGGKDLTIRVRNLRTKQILWKSTNLNKGRYGMTKPVWPTSLVCITRFNRSIKEPAVGNVFLTGNAFGQLRLFDRRQQQGPIKATQASENKINVVWVAGDMRRAYTGDTSGNVNIFNLQGYLKAWGVVRGSVGAVKEIRTHPVLHDTCGIVGYDRFLRIYCRHEKKDGKFIWKMTSKIYLTQRATTFVFSNDSGVVGGKRKQPVVALDQPITKKIP